MAQRNQYYSIIFDQINRLIDAGKPIKVSLACCQQKASCIVCLLPFALCPLPFAFCLLPFAFCLLPFAFCLLPFAFCLLPFAFCLLPFAFCLLPFAFCLLPCVCAFPFFAYRLLVRASGKEPLSFVYLHTGLQLLSLSHMYLYTDT